MGLREDLTDARARTLALTLDLDDEQWMGPRLPIVNPVLWEIGHVAWFQEIWTLRRPGDGDPARSGRSGGSLFPGLLSGLLAVISMFVR